MYFESKKNKILISKNVLVFCVLKKWVHSRIGQCVRPAVRLHDNSSQLHPIELKFCAHNCLSNISVEFEDENDPSRNGWVIEKIVIIDQTIPEGEYRDFFKKNIFLRIIHNIYKSTQFLKLIPNMILVLNYIVVF